MVTKFLTSPCCLLRHEPCRKKNAPYLYDVVITHALDWPSLTCQWFPDKESCVVHSPSLRYAHLLSDPPISLTRYIACSWARTRLARRKTTCKLRQCTCLNATTALPRTYLIAATTMTKGGSLEAIPSHPSRAFRSHKKSTTRARSTARGICRKTLILLRRKRCQGRC